MATVQVGLSALTLVTPVLPAGTTTLSVDTSVLFLSVLADARTVAVDVVVGGVLTSLTASTTSGLGLLFTGSVAVGGTAFTQVVEITARNYALDTPASTLLISPTVQFELLYAQSNLATSIAPPSGVTVYKGQSSCRIEWALPTYVGFQGVRVQYSTDASGVSVPFQQYGGLLNGITRTADVSLNVASTRTASTPNAAVPGQTPTNTVVETATSLTATVSYDAVSIPSSAVAAGVFYVLLTTLIQDPATNQVYESLAAGPYLCGFVNLKVVNPTDFLAFQKSNDIAGRMITEITRRRPDLDLTPRSEFRDLIINPLALELANLSTREWFSRCAVSISALSQIDDADGDGISDPVASSPYKQQIALAYGLSQTSVQGFIDKRFTVLGEQAGVPLGGATAAVVRLTFYSRNLPTAPLVVPLGLVCSTIPDTANPTAITFQTTGSATIGAGANAAAFYDAQNNWWAVTVPAQAVNAAAVSNVGAETIQQITGGGPSGVSVLNLNAANGGGDRQSNADYAAMIQNRQVAGKDSGTRNGYWNTSQSIPGIIDTLVVAAGDVDMVRDWSSLIERHTYGCVDIYARGLTSSQQTEILPFTLPATSTYGVYATYLTCTPLSLSSLSFLIAGFRALGSPIFTAVEMVARSAGRVVWLGTANAQFDNTNGVVFLNPTDQPYTINDDGSTTVWQINGANATNAQFLSAAGTSTITYSLMAQLAGGIHHIPALQPVSAVNTIVGPVSGTLPVTDVELVHTADFLLKGGSSQAGDAVIVSGALTQVTTATLTLATALTAIDDNMALPVDGNGAPTNILSVRSADLSTVYTFGVDYTIVASGPYRAYALKVLTTGSLTTGTTQVVVAYYKYLLNETVTLQSETVTLDGSTPVSLSNQGFIHNTWLPANHRATALLLDGAAVAGQAATGLIGAGVAPAARYIKVTYTNGAATTVMIEGKDFLLAVDSPTGTASVTRVLGGSIPDGATVTIGYYTVEVFSVSTEYPAFIQQLAAAVATTKHAGADVLCKAMIANAVDLVFNVVLDDSTTPDAVDGTIRTAAGLVIYNADTSLNQSQIVRAVQAVNGVRAVELPLLKCARADGSYDIGVVVPTGTGWAPLASDELFAVLALPANSFISTDAVLPNPTIPSGGTANSYVGWLHEGQAYRRALSVADFLTSTVASFYMIGTDDEISASITLPSIYSGKVLLTTPSSAVDPSALAFRATYQVFGAANADDITVASPEFLFPGTITVNYVSEG